MGASDFANLPHIGESVLRKEDYRFLTGAGQYTDDVVLANQAHAVFVRSPHAHARIKSIQTQAAQSAAGVLGVLPSNGDAVDKSGCEASNRLTRVARARWFRALVSG